MDTNKKYDNPNPKKTANVFSKFTFWWMKDMFWKGAKKSLEYSDLYNILPEYESQKLGDALERNWFKELENAKNGQREPSFRRTIIKTFAPSWVIPGITTLAYVTFLDEITFLFFGAFLKYFSPGSEISKTTAFSYGICLVLSSLFGYLLLSHSQLLNQAEGMRIRIACCSLIYRKVLRLNKVSSASHSAGQVLNLISNDVNKLDEASSFFQNLWTAWIQAILATFLLYQSVGISAVISVCMLFFQTIPLQAFIAKKVSKLRMNVARKTDKRLHLINEIVTAIQVIKMYAWEKPFEKLVTLARRKELAAIQKCLYLKGLSNLVLAVSQNLTVAWLLMPYIMMGNKICSSKIFPVILQLYYLNYRIVWFIPNALQLTGEANISIFRLQEYLLLEERQPITASEQLSDQLGGKKYSVVMKKITAKWQKNSITDSLSEISMKIKKASLCVIVGPVGSGKSSLLHVMLGELKPVRGSYFVNETISYAAQEPWIFVGTVRQNILFGKTYDAERYQNIIRICALKEDFENLPHGDKTLVSERGVSLSGGQRARINLARALYRDADVYILDDPFSSVDTHVCHHIFHECIMNFLANKTRIIVTNIHEFLKYSDWTVILRNGQIIKQGEYHDLLKGEKNLLEENDHFNMALQSVYHGRSRNISVLSEENSTIGDDTEEPNENVELLGKKSANSSVFINYIISANKTYELLLLIIFIILALFQFAASDYWIYLWLDTEDALLVNSSAFNRPLDTNENVTFSTYVKTEINMTRNSSYYFHDASTSTDNSIVEDMYTIINNTLFQMTDFTSESYNLSMDFAEEEMQEKLNITAVISNDSNISLYIYIGCSLAAIIFALLRFIFVVRMCISASKNLHQNMLASVIQGCMRFFHTHSAGQVMNRFSKDTGTMDQVIPPAFLDIVQVFVRAFTPIILVLFVNYLFIVPIIFTFLLACKIFTIYFYTARNVKHLESSTKSPVFTHLMSSLCGLTTIRACKIEEILCREFDKYQDIHSSAWYLSIAANSTLGFWLSIVISILLASVIFSFFIFNTDTLGASIGFSVLQMFILNGSVQFTLLNLMALIINMTSVERIKEFTELETEENTTSKTDKMPPDNWPDNGCIEFHHVNLRYSDPGPLMLNDISIKIKSGEKVGIVGRTGAGKTSLVNTLYRMVKYEGRITIDSIDIETVSLKNYRRRISIIPQEPQLFSTTIRENLDPFDILGDRLLWDALADVEMKNSVTSLDMPLESGGSSYSIGERQLLCMARAIVKSSQIVILDEATANIDPETDAIIQRTVKTKFKHCTVITIAHRLNTIMDSDRVLVMDSGSAIEFDQPHILLGNNKSFFFKLVQQTGSFNAIKMHETAKQAYSKMVANDRRE